MLAVEKLGALLDYFTNPFMLVGEGKFSWRQSNVILERLTGFERMAGRWIAAQRTLAPKVGRPPSYLRQSLKLTSRSTFEDAAAAGERFAAERTRAALAQKKANGGFLGNRTNLPEAQAKGVAANREAANTFAANVLPIVRQIQAAGVATFRGIAAALNDRGVRTARGGAWHDSTVRNLLARAG